MTDFVKPMLCKTLEWDGERDLPPAYAAEEKLDGHRVQVHCDDVAATRCYSRLGNVEKFPSWIYDLPLSPGSVLDGELVPQAGPQGAQEVSHLRTANGDKLKLVLFDVLVWRGSAVMHLPYHRRHAMLGFIATDLSLADGRVELIKANYDVAAAEFAQQILANGGEGVVLKHKGSSYRPGYRGNDWLKVKATFSTDVVITSADASPTMWRVRPGHRDPRTGEISVDGEPSSTCANVGLTYGFYHAGRLITVGSLGVTGPEEEMVCLIGRVAEVKAYGQYPDTKALRHPVFLRWRDDKSIEECTPGQ